MFIQSLILTILAALGVSNEPPPEDVEPSEIIQEEQHFCCKSTSFDGSEGHGEGCVIANRDSILVCSAVLYCPGLYSLDNGVVDCPK